MEPSTINKERINIRVGIIISYVTMAVSVVISIFYSRYLLNKLGDNQYGLNSFVLSITSWLSLLTFGLSSTYVRFATLASKKDGANGVNRINGFYFVILSVISAVALLIGSIITILFWTGCFPLNQYSDLEKKFINYLMVISVLSTSLSFLLNIFSLFENFLSKFIWLRSIDLLTKLLTTGISVLVIYYGGNIVWVACVNIAVQLLVGIANLLYCFKSLKMKIKFQFGEDIKKQLRDVLSFSFFVFLNIIIDQILSNYAKTALGFWADAKQVTLYALGLDFYTYEATMSTSISGSFFPKVNRLVVDGKDDEVKGLFLKVSKFQMALLFMVVGGFWASGKQFVTAWLGSDRVSVFYIGLIVMTICLVPLTQTLTVEIQRAYNKHKFRSFFYLGAAFVDVLSTTLCVIYLPYENKIYGAAFSFALAVLLAPIIGLNIFYKKSLKLPIGKYFKTFGIFLAFTATAVCVCYLIFSYGINLSGLNKWLNFIIVGASFALLYLLFIGIAFRKDVWSFFQRKKMATKKSL